MDLAEWIFTRLRSFVRSIGDPRAQQRAAQAVSPAEHRRHLELIASAIAGRRVAVLVAAGPGGAGGDALVFPISLDMLPSRQDNMELATLRAVIGGFLLRDPASVAPISDEGARVTATAAALVRALAAARAELAGAAARLAAMLALLRASRPSLSSLRGADLVGEAVTQRALGASVDEIVRLAPAVPRELLDEIGAGAAPGRSPAAARAAAIPLCGFLGTGASETADAYSGGGTAPGPTSGQQRQGRAADRVRRRALRQRDEAENPLTHSFEKVHTLEKYRGGEKRADGADELDVHGDALDELDLDEVVRTDAATAGTYRADLAGLSLTAAEVAEAPQADGALHYDEWDEGAHAYRRGWCAVRVERAPVEASPETAARFTRQALARYRRERAELAAELERLCASPRRRAGQPDGPEIDVDAIALRHGALRHGATGPEKLYISRPRHAPELAVALLLDRSLSADAWVDNRRVLDSGADALAALGSVLPAGVARTAALAFSSHTRHDCRLCTLKAFDEPWAAANRRLAALTPEGYTRIGPALRHTTSLLDREAARRKLLVLLSDGKPTDYDAYEGRYGIADVRQAVVEASRAGVVVFAVALDQRARGHLPRMFGPGGFSVVTRPRELVWAIGTLVRQRLARR